jgi:SAM-dependent methyltransferase
VAAHSHPPAFLLGLEGAALLRACAGDGFDRAFVQARIAETRALLEHASELGEGTELGRVGTVDRYREWSATYDEPGNPLIGVEEPVVRRILDGIPPGRALDAACGTGRHAQYLTGLGHDVIGVDSSPEMLARARARVPQALAVTGDLHRLPVPDRSLDLVVCALALTHVPALAPVLAEFARVLRPGGHLVTSDIHLVSLYLGGVASVRRPGGLVRQMPASRFLASDYLTAALASGLRPAECAEPRWPPSDTAGGPLARTWCGAAADADYEATPAAIIWHFRREEGSGRFDVAHRMGNGRCRGTLLGGGGTGGAMAQQVGTDFRRRGGDPARGRGPEQREHAGQ